MWNLKNINGIALKDDCGIELSYNLLNIEASNLYKAINKRCLVFCLCSNSIGSVLGYVSFINNNIVPVLLSSNLEKALVNNLLDTYKPDYVWLPKHLIEQFEEYKPVYEAYEYVLLSTNYDVVYPLYEELCLMLTTSGSTGSPKFVRQSYENVYDNAMSIVRYLELDDTERPITTLPMNYTYGLSIINSHLLVGATILLTDKGFMQKEFWDFFKSEEATSFGGVPYTYEMLDKLRFFRMNLPSLRYSTQAGGKLTPELHEKFAKNAANKGIKFVVMYGQCEATARMGYLPAEKSIEKCGSMGIAIPGGEFKLIDINGRDITEPRVTGELVYKGKNVTLGYAECGEDLAKGDERGGILRTGDMAQFDEDGYYYVVGRKKRFLKIYGNRVNLDEVDRLIKAEFQNLDCASSGEDDHMCIFLTDGEKAELVREFVSRKTGLNISAFKIITVDEIPKNDAGKTLYKELSLMK